MNEGTLRYHLQYLERRKFVYSKKEGRERLYFTYDPGLLRIKTGKGVPLDQRRVLEVICGEPGIKVSDISHQLDISKARCYQIAQRLKRDHLVIEVQNGNGIGYVYVTRERLMREMLVDLAEKMLRGEIDRETFFKLKGTIEEW